MWLRQRPERTLHRLKEELAGCGVKVSNDDAVWGFCTAKGCGSKEPVCAYRPRRDCLQAALAAAVGASAHFSVAHTAASKARYGFCLWLVSAMQGH